MCLGILDGQWTGRGIQRAGEQCVVVGAHDAGVSNDEVDVAGGGGNVGGGCFEGGFTNYVA